VRCLVSGRGSLILVEQSLESSVSGWVVGGVVLPAVPDDVEPGAAPRRALTQDTGRRPT
jgi:hypothetical protein